MLPKKEIIVFSWNQQTVLNLSPFVISGSVVVPRSLWLMGERAAAGRQHRSPRHEVVITETEAIIKQRPPAGSGQRLTKVKPREKKRYYRRKEARNFLKYIWGKTFNQRGWKGQKEAMRMRNAKTEGERRQSGRGRQRAETEGRME